MGNENRKAYLDKEHRIAIRREDIPKPGPKDVVVRIQANGICGSDVHFFKEGKLGNFIVQEPYLPGHECSGSIAALGSEVQGFAVDDLVTVEPGIPCGVCAYCRSGRYNLCKAVVFLSAPPVDGTFCDYLRIRADMVFPIPKRMSFEEAAMVEPCAVAVQAVNRARFRNGASGIVVGAGPIGLLTMQAFKAAGGGRVTCVEMNDFRRAAAKKLGADAVFDPSSGDAELNDSSEVVFETAGADSATEVLFRYAAPGGCAVQVGWPRSNLVKMDIARFIEKELDYVGVNRYANAYPTAIQWLCDGRFAVKDLITHTFPFDKVAEAFDFTAKNPGKVIKTVVVNKG